jgi:hypothetical protein
MCWSSLSRWEDEDIANPCSYTNAELITFIAKKVRECLFIPCGGNRTDVIRL